MLVTFHFTGAVPRLFCCHNQKTYTKKDLFPSLVELTSRGEAQRFFLKKEENWIGRDASLCSIVLADDLMVSPRHARLVRDARGVWSLENAGARNGTWLRFKKLPVENVAHFQVGEQRCLFKVVN